jgi:hypothetical protein
MSIEFADGIPFMIRALPGFTPSAEEMKDADLAYIFKMHIVNYVWAQTLRKSDLPLVQFGAVLERLLTECDANVHDFAIDILEDICEEPEREKVASLFNARTREFWREICARELR